MIRHKYFELFYGNYIRLFQLDLAGETLSFFLFLTQSRQQRFTFVSVQLNMIDKEGGKGGGFGVKLHDDSTPAGRIRYTTAAGLRTRVK